MPAEIIKIHRSTVEPLLSECLVIIEHIVSAFAAGNAVNGTHLKFHIRFSLGMTLDIYLPACELCGKPCVLSFLADCK